MFRWFEGQGVPVGGQSKFGYIFASRCKLVHSWYGLDGIYHTAYLCEAHLYVDTGGVLTDITPTGGIIPPTPPGVGGYGDDVYGSGTYGTPRPASPSALNSVLPSAWSLDNMGALLFAMTSADGRLLVWDPAVGGLAVRASTSPMGRCFVVTPERFIQVFGMLAGPDGGSFRRFGWCGQEDPYDWNFASVSNKAGFLDIEPSQPIITAIPTKNGTLIWTGTKAYVAPFLGLPYIYDYEWVADDCTPWSPLSMSTTSSSVLWTSRQGTFSFDGTTVVPIPCPVRAWVDDDVDLLYVREQAFGVHVSPFNEYWWFFPQLGQFSNTRAVIYNYREGWWSQARMARSAGSMASYTARTIMANGLYAMQHELGDFYIDAELPFLETFDLNLSSGARLLTFKQMQPDIEGDDTNLLFSLFYKMTSLTSEPELQTDLKSVLPSGYVDFRTTARNMRLRMSIKGPEVKKVSIGRYLVDVAIRGDR